MADRIPELEPVILEVGDISRPTRVKTRVAAADTTVSCAAEVLDTPGGWEILEEVPN